MSAKDAGQGEKKKENSKKQSALLIALIGIGALILIALIVIAIILLKGKHAEKVDVVTTNRNVVVTPDNIDEITNQIAEWEAVPEGYFNTRMCTEWHFADGSAVSYDAYVKNDKANTHDVYFEVFLTDDESEPILESPIIPIGCELTQIALDTPLDAGEYRCVIVYHLIDDEQNTVGTLRVGFEIVVEN